MSLGHEHGFVLIGLTGPMDVVNPSLSLSLSLRWQTCVSIQTFAEQLCEWSP